MNQKQVNPTGQKGQFKINPDTSGGSIPAGQTNNFQKFFQSQFIKKPEVLTTENQTENLLQFQKQRYEERIRQEKVIFDRKQKELAKKIEEVRQELIKLAKEIGVEAKHIQQSLSQNIPEPSEYHLNFLEKIKKILVLLRKKITESNTWLAVWQERSQKRRFYWFHFKKSGTKFWLSNERAVATQTG